MGLSGRFIWLTASVVFIGSALFAQPQSVPLGDVVRAPKPEKKAAKVVTNDDLPERPAGPPTATAESKQADNPAAKSPEKAERPHEVQVETRAELKNLESTLVRNEEQYQRQLETEQEQVSSRILQNMLVRTRRELQDVRDQLAKAPPKSPPGNQAPATAAPSTAAPATAPHK
jgi:hypothetical protein